MDNNSKVENTKVEVPKTKEMNDRDYLNDLLETEKNMGVNMTIALNEASNEKLYDELFDMFKVIKNKQRTLYECMFKYGWYSLEKAEEQKITQTRNQLEQKYQELNQEN